MTIFSWLHIWLLYEFSFHRGRCRCLVTVDGHDRLCSLLQVVVQLIEAKWRIYASEKITRISSDNGLAPEQRQTIFWTNKGILLIGPLGTNFSEILIEIQAFYVWIIRLKMTPANIGLLSWPKCVKRACGGPMIMSLLACRQSHEGAHHTRWLVWINMTARYWN